MSYRPVYRLTLLFTYYNCHVDNYLRTIFGYSQSRIVYNLDEALLHGVELSADGRIWGDFFAFANFTFQQTRKYGDVFDGSNALSSELSELPEFKVNRGVEYQREDGATASSNFRYVGATDVPVVNDDNYASGAPLGSAVELKHLGDFFTVDLLFKYPVLKSQYHQIGGGVSAQITRAEKSSSIRLQAQQIRTTHVATIAVTERRAII